MSMIPVTIWLVITLILGMLATLAIWARGITRARGWAIAAFLIASPVAAGSMAFALGWPVPLLVAPAGDHPVLGIKMVVKDGIYILLDNEDGSPRYYWIPWSSQLAKEIQKKMEDSTKGGGDGGGLMLKISPFEFSWNRHPKPWLLPQPKFLPDKPPQAEPPQQWESL